MIRESLSLLRHIRDDLGQSGVIVGVSGKDSLVTLDLCCEVFHPANVTGFHLEILPGLDCIEQTLRMAEGRYGITVHRLVHPDMAEYLRFSRYRKVSPEIEDSIRRNLRWNDIYAIMRQRTGSNWIAQGHRVTDSLQRRAMLQSKQGIEHKQRRIYPIWDWKPKEVFSYLREKRIPIPVMFGSRIHKTSGIAPGSVDCLLFLRKEFPGDYRRLVEVFPQAEVMLERDELRARYAIEQGAA